MNSEDFDSIKRINFMRIVDLMMKMIRTAVAAEKPRTIKAVGRILRETYQWAETVQLVDSFANPIKGEIEVVDDNTIDIFWQQPFYWQPSPIYRRDRIYLK